MYRFAAVGDFENTAYFGAIGAETFYPQSAEEASGLIGRLAKGNYAVIFVSEKYYTSGFDDFFLPAVIPLPEKGSSFAEDRISAYVKKAIGSDMIFDD